MTNEIFITFWEKRLSGPVDGTETEILSYSTSVNPNYTKDQPLFLEFNCSSDVPIKYQKKSLKLTEFKIVDIHQGVRHNLSGNRNFDNFSQFNYHTNLSIEIFVKKVE